LKDGKEVNAVMLVGRLFHARVTVTVTRNHPSPMVLSRVRGTIRRYLCTVTSNHLWYNDGMTSHPVSWPMCFVRFVVWRLCWMSCFGVFC